MADAVANETIQTTQTSSTDQAAADALAAQAAKTGGESAAKTAEQIAAEAAAAKPKDVVYALTIPKDSVLEAKAVESVMAFAKEHHLTNEAAQKALERENAAVAADRTRQTEANVEAFGKLARETWPGEIKADKEFGGDKYDATLVEVKRAAEKYITPEEKEILNSTGWGNHPLLVKFFARVGRAMANDTLTMGGGAGAGQRDTTLEGRAARLYPEKP